MKLSGIGPLYVTIGSYVDLRAYRFKLYIYTNEESNSTANSNGRKFLYNLKVLM